MFFAIIDPIAYSGWTNEGECVPTGPNPACGPGTQLQKQTGTDGTIDKCTEYDMERTITCSAAGVSLPPCGGNKNT